MMCLVFTRLLVLLYFDELYERYEADASIPKKTVKAQELILDILKERAETGRIYIMNLDHCNSHSSFLDKVEMSNLCQEITLPTRPLNHIDGDGEIALCILSAVNVGKIRKLSEMEELCDPSSPCPRRTHRLPTVIPSKLLRLPPRTAVALVLASLD